MTALLVLGLALAACGEGDSPLGREAYTSTTGSTTAAPALPPASEPGSGLPATVELSAALQGAEVGPSPGDPDGAGEITVDLDRLARRLCYDLRVRDIGEPQSAHVHQGRFGSPGPAVVALEAPVGGESSGCATVTEAVADGLARDPDGYYVAVRTAEHPDGAIRGQLTAATGEPGTTG